MHPPLNESFLQQHASGLRAVARGLLSDEHAAEDVLQETWVAAIERPPASDSRLSGWLAGVVRRLALKRMRSEGRRRRREEGASQSEALASVDENLEQREVLRGVIDAVLALPEPYQSVVFMRYYQDLPPREIATRLDAPVATVKSQLHRALDMLRRRLDAEAGGERRQWALALAAATGWQAPAAPPAPFEPTPSGHPFGEWAMEWKLLAGGLAVFVTGVSASHLVSDGEGESAATSSRSELVTPSSAEESRVAAPLAAPDELGRPAQGTREAVAAGGVDKLVSATSAAVGARSYSLSGVVLDEFDLPLSGAHVFVGPLGQPLNDLGETDEHGRFSIQWRGHDASMDVAVSVRNNGYGEFGLRELALTAGEAREVAFVLGRQYQVRSKVEADLQALKKRAAEAGTKVELSETMRSIELLQVATASYRVAPRFGPSLDANGATRFSWPTADALERKERESKSFGRIERIKLVKESGALAELVELEVSLNGQVGSLEFAPEGNEPEPAEAAPVRLGGIVTDENGNPVPKALVAVRESPELGWSRFHANADGAFAIEILGANSVEVRAGGGLLGRAAETLDLSEAGGTLVTWNATLDRGLELLGTLADTQGRPLVGWTVEFASSGSHPVRDTAVTDAAGRFSIPNLPDVAGSVFARSPGSDVFGVEVATGLRPGGESSWTLDAEPTGELALAVRDAAGSALPRAEVRVWQASTGRGQWALWSKEREAYTLAGVVPGRYRIAAGSVSTGFVDMGQVHVSAGESLDLGSVALPEAGRLGWSLAGELDPQQVSWRLFRTGADLDTWIADGTLAQPFEDLVPGGDYSLELRTPLGVLPRTFAEVKPGEESRVQIDARSVEPFRLTVDRGGDAVEVLVRERGTQRTLAAGQVPAGGALELLLEPDTYRVEVAGESLELAFPHGGGEVSVGGAAAGD